MLKAGNFEAVDLILSGPFGRQHLLSDLSATMQEVRVVEAATRCVQTQWPPSQ